MTLCAWIYGLCGCMAKKVLFIRMVFIQQRQPSLKNTLCNLLRLSFKNSFATSMYMKEVQFVYLFQSKLTGRPKFQCRAQFKEQTHLFIRIQTLILLQTCAYSKYTKTTQKNIKSCQKSKPRDTKIKISNITTSRVFMCRFQDRRSEHHMLKFVSIVFIILCFILIMKKTMLRFYLIQIKQSLSQIVKNQCDSLQQIVDMQGNKKVKVDQNQPQLPKNVWIQFKNNKNQSLGVYSMPVEAGPKQFQELVNKLINQDLKSGQGQDFNFFHKTKQIKNRMQIFFEQIQYKDFQANFQVIYHPVSNYKVKPITRASSSMYGHTQAVLSLNFSPDCKNLASGSGDATVRLWDIYTQTPLKQIKVDNWVMIVLWSPDGQKLAYAQKNGNITIYKLKDDTSVKLNGHSKWVTSLAWEPLHINQNCNRIVSASKDFTLRLWNIDDGTCERSFGNHTKCVTKVLWSGRNQIYSASEDQRIHCFDGKGNFLRQLKKHSHWVNTMSLSTQHVLKRGCYQPGKFLQDKLDKKEKALQLYNKSVQHHGQRLVTGSDDFTLQLFYLPEKIPRKQMTGHGKPINHVQFSPDGRYIVSGSFDKKIKLWDGYTGDFMYTFDGHVGPVYLISWSVDSRYLVSGSQDSTLKLWDIKTRKLMMDLPGHADQIYALDWDINGNYVVSGGKDRQVKLWTN